MKESSKKNSKPYSEVFRQINGEIKVFYARNYTPTFLSDFFQILKQKILKMDDQIDANVGSVHNSKWLQNLTIVT